MSVQVPNGMVDIAGRGRGRGGRRRQEVPVLLPGPAAGLACADQRLLRRAIPENRLRVYDVRKVIETLCRRGLGAGAAPRLRARHGDGAGPHRGPAARHRRQQSRRTSPARSTRDGSDKAARFLQLCDAFDLPVLFLCDTPGIMVGPEVEKTALVRHCSRLFVIGANLGVPFGTIVLRKAYGLGAQAMAGGTLPGRRPSPSPGRPASSAAWGSRAR